MAKGSRMNIFELASLETKFMNRNGRAASRSALINLVGSPRLFDEIRTLTYELVWAQMVSAIALRSVFPETDSGCPFWEPMAQSCCCERMAFIRGNHSSKLPSYKRPLVVRSLGIDIVGCLSIGMMQRCSSAAASTEQELSYLTACE